MKYITKWCPHCGHTLTFMNSTKYQYGSPFRTCPKCNKGYTDTSFVEVVCTDETVNDISKITGLSIASIVTGLFFLIMAFVAGLSEFYGVLFLVAGLFFATGGIYLAHKDAKTYDKRIEEFNAEVDASKKRLSNPDYVKALLAINYPVPPAYVKAANEQSNKASKASATSTINHSTDRAPFKPNCNEESIASSANKIIWANAIDFIKNGWNNADIPDLVYFWTALYYSAYDILLQHNLTEIVLKILLVELSSITGNSSADTDDEPIGAISHFQRKILANLESSVIEPCSQSGMTEILEFACYVCYEDYEPTENAAIDAITMSEYALATANVTMELSCLLNTKEGPATQEEEGEREQALKYVKEWDRVPSVDDLIGKAQNQPGGDRTPGKDIAKGDNGPELT